MPLRNFLEIWHWVHWQTFYRSNWIWKVNGKLQFWKYPNHRYTKVSHRESSFSNEKFQNRLIFTICNPVFTLPIRILLKPWTLFFRKDTVTAILVSTNKRSRRKQKHDIYLANERSGLVFFSTNLGHTFVTISARNLEWYGEEIDLANLHLPTTLSAYSLSWYIQPSLCTKFLMTQKLPYFVAFVLFQSWKLVTIKPPDSTWNIRHLATAIQTTAQKVLL